VWRFSVEDPLTNKRHSFADLSALMDWIRAEMNHTTTTLQKEVTANTDSAPL
jgi:hypothetical protein